LITNASTIIAYGKIYKYYPTKPVYLAALFVYLVCYQIVLNARSAQR